MVRLASLEQTHPLSVQAREILEHRYLLKNEQGQVVEEPSELFHRVADAVAAVDGKYGYLQVENELFASDLYDIMSSLKFLPNSPTLMNAGTEQGTLSACFVLPLEDSMEGIMKTASNTAMVQKFGGGTGFSLSNIRPRGDKIKTTHGIACGPIEVLKVLSRVSSMITQGGKRDGANMAVMSVYHPDILDFIRCKSIEGDVHNFNISVGVDSNWMECVKHGLDYQLINPHTNTIVGTLNAKDVFDEIVAGAWANGEPGMIFLDRVNEDNHVIDAYGPMIATNPCGEQPLLGNESCNLGSINLAKFFVDKDIQFADGDDIWQTRIDWDGLRRTVQLAVRFLDNVIDANKYATPEIEEMTKQTRKIGLGIMGFADLLIQLRIPYNSEMARNIGSVLMQEIRMKADETSRWLGVSRGVFPAWQQSDYKDTSEYYRNACRLTVAPTGTISMIADCSSGIEPIFALAWTKQNILEGKTMHYFNSYFEDDAEKYEFASPDLRHYLIDGGSIQDRTDVPEWIKQIYGTTIDILPEDHINMQAVFQEECDAGISKTINLPSSASIEDVANAYSLAWQTRCKGITLYRNGSRLKEVLTSGHQEAEVFCCDAPKIIHQDGCEKCLNCDWSACLIA